MSVLVIQPALWIAIAFLAVRGSARLTDRPQTSRVLIGIAAIAGLFQVGLTLTAGLLTGFGRSPNLLSASSLPRNLWFVVALVLGVEASRSFVLQAFAERWQRWATAVVTIIWTAPTTALALWVSIDGVDSFFRVGVGQLLPALTVSAVATSFATTGDPWASAAYRLPVIGLAWLSPILPDLSWPVAGMIGTLTPLLALAVARGLYTGTADFTRRYPDAAIGEDSRNRRASWLVTVGLSVLIVLFTSGRLGVEPMLLTGISMEPAFQRGDVLLIRQVDPLDIQINDVVTFHRGRLDYAHRVIGIEGSPGSLVFTTKGDNVDRSDPPVTAAEIDGKVVFVLPKIGLPSLWIRDVLSSG